VVEQEGAQSPGCRPWGRNNTFCSQLKTRFKADIKPKIYLKMLYFLKKAEKITAANPLLAFGETPKLLLQSFVPVTLTL